jgi:cold shock CspA family protein
MRGTMIWFNAEKGHGYISTEDGERLYVAADAFLAGPLPPGRCGGTDVSFERVATEDGGAEATAVVVEEAPDGGRAGYRRRGTGSSLVKLW